MKVMTQYCLAALINAQACSLRCRSQVASPWLASSPGLHRPTSVAIRFFFTPPPSFKHTPLKNKKHKLQQDIFYNLSILLFSIHHPSSLPLSSPPSCDKLPKGPSACQGDIRP